MGTVSANLPPCPDSPNCVSSQASSAGHRVEPFVFNDRPELAIARLKKIIMSAPRTTLVKEEGGYLHFEARSFLFGFVDDVVCVLDADNGIVHIRSASRTGTYDFGVNRRRVERFRKAFDPKQH